MELRLSTSPHTLSHGDPPLDVPHTKKSISASATEAIFRRLRSRSPYADHLSTTCAQRQHATNIFRCPCTLHAAGDSRNVRVSFNAHPRMPYSDRVRAHLSTPTTAFRCAMTTRRRPPRCLRSHLHLSRQTFRSQPKASGSASIFRPKLQACSTARAVSRRMRIFRRQHPPPPRHQPSLPSCDESFRRHSCRPPPC